MAEGSGRQTLVLGGTSWLGGEVARQANERGHEVTCLARGESGSAPDGVRWVRADRWQEDAYAEVEQQQWDAVVDVSRQPVQVRSALAALASSTAHWVFVSTGNVYAEDTTPGQDESASLHDPWAGDGEAGTEDYGPAKVACEEACRAAVAPDRLLLARVGLIGGYGDLSDRFGYWPGRLARARDNEPVLVPPLDTQVGVIDVVDLASWLVDATENATAGAFNAVGDTLPLSEILNECARAAGVEPGFVEVDQDWLVRHEVAPWSGEESLPLWLPLPEYAGFMTRTSDAARSHGLHPRPLAETIADSLAWERELGLGRPRKAGLTPAREKALLADLALDRRH